MSGSEPGVGSFELIPSDGTTYSPPIRSLYVTTGGAVHFVGADGVADTWTVADKTTIPVMMTKVYESGTDATGLHGIR